MILIEDYATKVETFVGLWREEAISDIELVEAITNLGKEVLIIQNNYVANPSIQIINKRKPQD